MNESTVNGDNDSQLDSREECGHEPKKKKASRNLSEKKRRDKLNIYISELASMVPSCATSQRKLDKTTVLKMTVNYMKVHNDLTMSVLGNESGLMSSFLASEELGELLDKALSGFLLVLSKTGDLVFVSKSIEDLLGIKKESLIGKSMLEVVHPDDKQLMIREVFKQEDDQSTAFTNQDLNGLEGSPSRRIFNFRMLLRSPSGDPVGWETVHCVGYSDQWTKKISSRKKQGMVGGDNGESADSLDAALAPFFLVGVGILSRPSFIRLVDSDCEEDEFSSRHSLDGKFLFIDPRSIPITGYLPFEILGTSVYNYIHQDDLSIYSKAHESLMEYGESKTGCYRILIKGYQWMWATTRSYISFNHWNSKPEIYCSTTKMMSATEGARSLEVRQKEEEIMKANQDNHKSRFSLQKTTSTCNSPQEANVMVLAKWAADEQNFRPLSAGKSEFLVETEFTEEQGAMENIAKGDVEVFPLGIKTPMNEAPSAGSDSDTREARDTDSDLFDLPSTVEELNSFREAQRLLQDQLVEKHSILMKAVSKQKEQLKEIQQHMILNLQSQLFVDPVKIQETCSSYLERNKVLSERHEEQEQALDTISRKLEEQIQNAEQRYQRHFKAVMEKKALEQRRPTPEQNGVPGASLSSMGFRGQPPAQINSAYVVTEADDETSHPQRIVDDVSLQARHTASPLELIPLDSRVDLQKQAHIEEIQGGLSFLKRSSDSPKPLRRNPKVSRIDANPNQLWTQAHAMSADTPVEQSMADSVPSNTVGFNGTSQIGVQPFSPTNGCTSITATTSVMASPLSSSRMLDPQSSQAVHNHDTLQSSCGGYPSVRTGDESRTLHHLSYPPPQQGSSTNVGMATQPLHDNASFAILTGQSGDQFAINQLESTVSSILQQQQQEQQQSQMNAGLAQTIGQLFMNSAQNQQIMQVLLTVLSALQAQPQVAASLMTLIKQMQGNTQQQEEAPTQPQPVPSSSQFVEASSRGQPTSELLNTASTPYSYMNNVTYQQQPQKQQAREPPGPARQRLSHQPQQATRRDRETAGLSGNRVSSTTTSYSVALHQQQQQQQQQVFQQPFSRSSLLANPMGSNSLGFVSYETMPSTSVASPATATRDLGALDKKKHSKSKSDYFSNFSSEELRAMLVASPGSAEPSPVPKQDKKLEDNELLYNPLLTQQQQLLQLHQEQRRQLLLHQQEQRLLMFEEQRKQQQRREAEQQQQQQQHTASPSSPSSFGGGSLHALLSQDPQEGSSRQASDTSVQDTGASFSGWSEHSYGLGEADEQVLSLLLAESTFDPVLENLDWGDDSYTGDINLNPD